VRSSPNFPSALENRVPSLDEWGNSQFRTAKGLLSCRDFELILLAVEMSTIRWSDGTQTQKTHSFVELHFCIAQIARTTYSRELPRYRAEFRCRILQEGTLPLWTSNPLWTTLFYSPCCPCRDMRVLFNNDHIVASECCPPENDYR
jgi:hypothetical protein